MQLGTFMTKKTQSDYSKRERETSILQSANAMFLREFWSGSQSPYLTEKGKYFLKEITPEPMTKKELDALLTPVHPEQEFNFRDYVKELEDLLTQDPSPLGDQPLYQYLTERGRLEKLSDALNDYDLTLRNFHVLLGIHILNVGVEQRLISPGKEQYCFKRNF